MALAKKTKKNLKIIAGSVVMVGWSLYAVLFFATDLAPHSEPGGWHFLLAYTFSLDRPAKLNEYSDIMHGRYRSLLRPDEKNTVHYIPAAVDRYLCSRLVKAWSEDEKDAILVFYAKQAGGRQGDCVVRLGEPVAARLVGLLRFTQDPQLQDDLLILLEGIRSGHAGKRHLPANASVDVFRDAYLFWWNLPMQWEQKRLIDPLKNTELKWVSP